MKYTPPIWGKTPKIEGHVSASTDFFINKLNEHNFTFSVKNTTVEGTLLVQTNLTIGVLLVVVFFLVSEMDELVLPCLTNLLSASWFRIGCESTFLVALPFIKRPYPRALPGGVGWVTNTTHCNCYDNFLRPLVSRQNHESIKFDRCPIIYII